MRNYGVLLWALLAAVLFPVLGQFEGLLESAPQLSGPTWGDWLMIAIVSSAAVHVVLLKRGRPQHAVMRR